MSVASISPETRHRRTRRVVVLAVVLGIVGAVAGALVGFRLSSIHTATTSVLVAPLNGNPYTTTGTGAALVNLETEAQLVSSTDVVSRVQQAVPGVDASTLQSNVSVSVPSNTQILTIAYSSRQSDQSVRIAQAFAESYLDYRTQRATALIQTQVDQINSQVKILTKQQATLGKKLNKVDQDSGDATYLRAQLESVTSQLDQLKANLADLRSTSLEPGQVISPAAPPAPGVVPLWALTALGGLLGGVVLGVLLGSLALARRSGVGPVLQQPQDAGSPA